VTFFVGRKKWEAVFGDPQGDELIFVERDRKLIEP
jgi:hypothetical protein